VIRTQRILIDMGLIGWRHDGSGGSPGHAEPVA
jgi:hypothetical protein